MFVHIVIWDYWMDANLNMAYCIVYKNGILMFSESPMEKNNG